MKKYRYTGLFDNECDHTYELTVSCGGYLQALFLLTAKAIESGRHWQLHSITDENGYSRLIGDVSECMKLITDPKTLG